MICVEYKDPKLSCNKTSLINFFWSLAYWSSFFLTWYVSILYTNLTTSRLLQGQDSPLTGEKREHDSEK